MGHFMEQSDHGISRTKPLSVIEINWPTRVVLCLLACFLLLPIVWGYFFTDAEERSRFEKRKLAEFPSLAQFDASGRYFSDVEKYLDDHIGFAIEINRFYSKIESYLFNHSSSNGVSFGQDGFVFLNSHDPSEPDSIFKWFCTPRLSPALTADYIGKIEKVNNAIKAFGHRAIFTVPISKPTLYPEKLPDDIGQELKTWCSEFMQRENILKALQAQAEQRGILFHYPYAEFLAAKNEPHFYPKENFHWRGGGGHLFSKKLFETLGLKIDNRYSEGARLIDTRADLVHLIGFERPIKVWYYPYEIFKLSENKAPELDYMLDYYSRMHTAGFSYYTSAAPLQQKDAIMISHSFGAYVSRDLAVGYRSIKHINIAALQDHEMEKFYKHLFSLGENMDIILLFHDANMASDYLLNLLADSIGELKP